MMKQGTYTEIRDTIVDGDLIFVARSPTILGRITEFVTRSPFYHVGIAFWMRDSSYESRLFMVEAHQGGRRIVSLSSYAGQPLHIVKSEVPFGTYSKDLLDRAGSVPYSYLDFVSIGLLEVFRLKLHRSGGEVCSEMVVISLNKGGLYLPTLISPGSLYRRLVGAMNWVVAATTTGRRRSE